MQFAYYTSLSGCVYFCTLFAGHRPHLAQIFSQHSFDTDLKYGYCTVFANVLNIIFWVVANACIVEKAKKCLDFTITVFVVHLFVMCPMYGIPSFSPLSWWCIHIALITVSTLISEAVCMKLESQEIKLSINELLEQGTQQAKHLVRQAVSGAETATE